MPPLHTQFCIEFFIIGKCFEEVGKSIQNAAELAYDIGDDVYEIKLQLNQLLKAKFPDVLRSSQAMMKEIRSRRPKALRRMHGEFAQRAKRRRARRR